MTEARPDAAVASEASPRPIHDRPTLVSYASLATWSWMVYAFGASLALLRDDQGTAAWLGGLHGTALALGGVIGALVTPRLNHRFGRGRTARFGAIGAAVCMTIYLLPGMPVGGTLTAILVTCFFGNIIVVVVNSFIASHQGAASAPAFTESLSLAALMGLLAPLGIGLAAASVLGWRAGMFIAVIAFAIIEVWRGRDLGAYGGAGEVRMRKDAGALPTRTYWAVAAGTMYLGAEFCLSLWGVDLLRDRAGLSPATAAAALSTVLGGIFVGRLVGIRLTERFASEKLLRTAILAGLVAFMVAWSVTVTAVILVALFLTGVGLALVWPLSLARIIRSSGDNPDRASAITLASTTGAIGVAPFVLGAFAGAVGVHSAFLLVPVLLVAALVLVVIRPVADEPAARTSAA